MIDFAIRRKTAISMFFLGLSLLGYISYRYLPVELLPSVELPFLIIQVNGARDSDPFQLEREAIIPLEGAVGTLEGIDKVQSYADERGGAIFVYYTTEVDLKYAYLKLQEKVNEVRRTLPEDYFAMVQKVDTEQLSNMFMNLQVRGERALGENEAEVEFVARCRVGGIEGPDHRRRRRVLINRAVAQLDVGRALPCVESAQRPRPSRVEVVLAADDG